MKNKGLAIFVSYLYPKFKRFEKDHPTILIRLQKGTKNAKI